MKTGQAWRKGLETFIRRNAKPADKFSHQPRLYRLARQLAGAEPFDDDVLHAAAWLHDLGVFIGHRPEEPQELSRWNNVRYAMEKAPGILLTTGFPAAKIDAVVEIIRTHQPSEQPETFEGILLRDADILEQLGAVGILRTVSKVGRDTRFQQSGDALRILERNLDVLPGMLRLEASRKLAKARLKILRDFLEAAVSEANGGDW